MPVGIVPQVPFHVLLLEHRVGRRKLLIEVPDLVPGPVRLLDGHLDRIGVIGVIRLRRQPVVHLVDRPGALPFHQSLLELLGAVVMERYPHYFHLRYGSCRIVMDQGIILLVRHLIAPFLDAFGHHPGREGPPGPVFLAI